MILDMQTYSLNMTFPFTNKTINFRIGYNNTYGYSNTPSALPNSSDIIYNDGSITLRSVNPNVVTYAELIVVTTNSGPDGGYFTIRFMADSVFLALFNDEMAATTSGYVPYVDGNIVMFTFSVMNFTVATQLYANLSPTYCAITGDVTILSNICFIGETIINTDQGKIKIESLVKNEYSIKKNKIVAIAKILSTETELVVFEKDSIQPNKDMMEPEFRFTYQGKQYISNSHEKN